MNKKVLLRERKRHTAHRVVTTPSVVLTGYPPPGHFSPPGRVPPGRVPLHGRVPPGRVPPWQGYPRSRVPPQAGPGRVLPPGVCPMGILGNVAKHYGIWVPPPLWTDRLMEGQTRVKTLPFRRTTYAGGNNVHRLVFGGVCILSSSLSETPCR